MDLYPVLKGAATYVPFLYRATRGRTGGSIDTRYCYGVWLRHLVRLHAAGAPTLFRTLAELGPGDSLGIGLAAVLCGVDRLLALDVVRYADSERNHAMVDAIVGLLRQRAPIPRASEFPGLFPNLDSYAFPSQILTDARLAAALDDARVDSVHAALRTRNEVDGLSIRYVVPWETPADVEAGSLDIVISQAVLEHVEDLAGTYDALCRWLKPGGVMSHVVDFRSHRITANWDGHRQYPSWLWRIVRGRRPYLLNRIALGTHLRLLSERAFEVRGLVRDVRQPTLGREDLAAEFRSDSDGDRGTASAAFIAIYRPEAGLETGARSATERAGAS